MFSAKSALGGALHRATLVLVALALLPLITACEDVIVVPVDVAVIRIVPDDVQLTAAETLQLQAELTDQEGRSVRGYPVDWTSDDVGIAAVDSQGRVVGDRSGTTTIRARVGSVEGTARVQVLTAPSIVLSDTAVSFTMESGGPLPPSQEVDISNGGEAELSGLSATVETGGPEAWLAASLSRTIAPATLVISITADGLPPAEYTGEIQISAATAPGDGRRVVVSLTVVSAPPPTVPNPPSDLRVDHVMADEIALVWTSDDDSVTEFRMERRLDGETFQTIATIEHDRTRFVDDSVQPDSRYTYRLRACNAAGCSDPSNEVQAATVPAGPTNLRTDMVQSHRIRIAWTNNSSVEPWFRIERAEGSGQFSVLATTDEGATFYDDRDVVPARTYHYRVSACNDTGCSEPSNTITVTVPS